MDLLRIGRFFYFFYFLCGCQPAVDKKLLESIVKFSQALTTPSGQKKESAGLIESIGKKAQDENPEFRFQPAAMYIEGKMEQSYEKAAKWYEKAAIQGLLQKLNTI